MMTSKRIGRVALCKYYVIVVLIGFIVPVIIEMDSRESLDLLKAIKSVYKLNSMSWNDGFTMLIQLIILLLGIWWIGGKIGVSIIERSKHKYGVSFLGILLIYVLHFVSSSLLLISTSHDEAPIHLVINAMVYMLYFSLGIGVIHGLVVSYFIGGEIESKGQRSQE